MDLDDTVLVPFYLFVKVVGLDLDKNFDNCLLKFGPGHEFFVIWSSKPFFSNLNSSYRLHSVSNLVIYFIHEVANTIAFYIASFLLIAFEHYDITLLFELNLVQHFYARMSRLQVVVEMSNVLDC